MHICQAVHRVPKPDPNPKTRPEISGSGRVWVQEKKVRVRVGRVCLGWTRTRKPENPCSIEKKSKARFSCTYLLSPENHIVIGHVCSMNHLTVIIISQKIVVLLCIYNKKIFRVRVFRVRVRVRVGFRNTKPVRVRVGFGFEEKIFGSGSGHVSNPMHSPGDTWWYNLVQWESIFSLRKWWSHGELCIPIW